MSDAAGPVFVGALNRVRPIGYTPRGGSARSARLLITQDRLVFEPFGVWRGIFHRVVVSKHVITVIYPTTDTFILMPGRSGRGLVIEQPLAGSGTPEQVQFFPKGPVAPILRALEEQHYQVDPKPRKAKIVG